MIRGVIEIMVEVVIGIETADEAVEALLQLIKDVVVSVDRDHDRRETETVTVEIVETEIVTAIEIEIEINIVKETETEIAIPGMAVAGVRRQDTVVGPEHHRRRRR